MKSFTTNYIYLVKYIKLFYVFVTITCLSACGSGGGNSNPSTQQSQWEVVSKSFNGYRDDWDMRTISSSQTFESNTVYGILNGGLYYGTFARFEYFYYIRNSYLSWDRPSEEKQFWDRYKILSCYKNNCMATSDSTSDNLHLFGPYNLFYGNRWWKIVLPAYMKYESFSAINTTGESSFYVATNSKQIYSCSLSLVYESGSSYSDYVANCQDFTYDYTGSNINGITTPDNSSDSSVYLMSNEGIWQLKESATRNWTLMPQSPTNGNTIKSDIQGRVFVTTPDGGYYYNGNTWQQILNTPQSSVTLCDIGNFSGNNEKAYFSTESTANNYVNVFHPTSGNIESISSYMVSPDTGETFNTGIYNLTTANNCYIYGLSKYNNRVYVVNLK